MKKRRVEINTTIGIVTRSRTLSGTSSNSNSSIFSDLSLKSQDISSNNTALSLMPPPISYFQNELLVSNNDQNYIANCRDIFHSSNLFDMTSAIKFDTCLLRNDVPMSPAKQNRAILLKRALSIQELEDSNWLTSSLMNLVLMKFAREYGNVYFMPVEFVMLGLSNHCNSKVDFEDTCDIMGRRLNFDDPTIPILIIFNLNNIHWNLIRIIRSPHPELQLFEPMVS